MSDAAALRGSALTEIFVFAAQMQPHVDCSACLTGGRAQSALHFSNNRLGRKQQTGEGPDTSRGGETGEGGRLSL